MMTFRGRVGVAVLAAGLVVGMLACASASDENDASGSAPPTTPADTSASGGSRESGAATAAPGAEPNAFDEAASAAGGGDAGRTALAPDPAQVVAATRDVVRTGTMQLTVDDVDDAAADVTELVTGAGGFVSSEQARASDNTIGLTVRIPSDRFEEIRGQIGKLGTVESQQIDAEDVTAQMVDVQSRIDSLQASVDRVRGLLSGAGDVGQLAIVEGELARREAELEALEGQQRVLADQVSLGTLTIDLGEEPPPPEPADDIPGFGANLHRGWVALVDVGQVALATIGLILPFLLVLAPFAIAGWVMYRRRRRPTAPTSTPPSSPSSTPPGGPGTSPTPEPEPAPTPVAAGD
jgi:hypothetical protein